MSGGEFSLISSVVQSSDEFMTSSRHSLIEFFLEENNYDNVEYPYKVVVKNTILEAIFL